MIFRVRLALGLAAVTVLWLPTLPHPFLVDDQVIILHNPLLDSLGNLPKIFTTHYWAGTGLPTFGAYRPLTVATYALNAATTRLTPWGLTPGSFRLINILLLIADAWLVALVALRWGIGALGAWLAAMFFALHPVHVEPVVNVVGRAELLMTLFVLLGLLAWWRWMESPSPRRLAVIGVCLIAAMLSKEQGILLLPLIALAFIARPSGFRAPSRRHWIALAATLLVIASLCFFTRLIIIGGVGMENIAVRASVENPILRHPVWPARLLTPLWLTAKAWALLWWPAHLQADYGFDALPIVTQWADPTLILALVILALTGCLAGLTRRVPGVLFGLGTFLIGFSLVCNGPLVIGTLFAERLLTLPSVGWALVAGALAERLARLALARKPKGRVPLVALAATLLIGLGARASLRTRVWSSEEAYWTAALRDAPRSVKAHIGSARYLMREARRRSAADPLREAHQLLLRARNIDPDAAEVFHALGEFENLRFEGSPDPDVRRQALDAAQVWFAEAVRLNPENPMYRMSHAVSLVEKVKRGASPALLDQAITDLRVVINLQPARADAWTTLHELLRRRGRAAEAEALAVEFERHHSGESLTLTE